MLQTIPMTLDEALKAADSQATVLALRTATRRVAIPYAGPTRPPGKWEK